MVTRDCFVVAVKDAQSSDAGNIGCRIPSRNLELTKNLTVLGTHKDHT